jgi:hypothetical protein
MKAKSTDILMQNKIFGWIAAATAVILLVPLIAMQFTKEVNWTVSDFVIMGILLFGMGALFIVAARRVHGHRLLLGVVFLATLLYIWAELAVGIFTNWGS